MSLSPKVPFAEKVAYSIIYQFGMWNADGKVAEAEEDRDSYGWLEEIEIPEESKMDVIQYMGPQVVE